MDQLGLVLAHLGSDNLFAFDALGLFDVMWGPSVVLRRLLLLIGGALF